MRCVPQTTFTFAYPKEFNQPYFSLENQSFSVLSEIEPELVEQGAGLITDRLVPALWGDWGGGAPPLLFRLCPEMPPLMGVETPAPLSTVIPGVSMFTLGLVFEISVACFNT